ncbi:MAG TPA: hypothetical protein VIT92_11725 [Burkholderiaceae bacterium]
MSTFGKEVPIDRPAPGERAAIFVPAREGDEAVKSLFKNGSGLVGFGNHDGTVTVYYENNRFNESVLFKWEQKVFKSYERMVKSMPTTSKVVSDADNLVQIGLIQGSEILVKDMEVLHRWLTQTGTMDTAPEGPEIFATGGR